MQQNITHMLDTPKMSINHDTILRLVYSTAIVNRDQSEKVARTWIS